MYVRYGKMTRCIRTLMVILGIGGLLGLASCANGAKIEHQNAVARRVPLIYCTDLFHPHGDPDDHFDLATLICATRVGYQGDPARARQIPEVPIGAHAGGTDVSAHGATRSLRHWPESQAQVAG